MRVLLLAGLLLVAGCVSPGAVEPASLAEGGIARAALVEELRAAPAPALDGVALAAWLSGFVDAHHPRVTGTPSERAAADDLARQLRALGYDVSVKTYNARGLPSVDGPLRVVVGEKRGLVEPEALVLIGAHYDTSLTLGNADVPGLPYGTGVTLYAAYDNGSGTAMVMELARLLAEVPTDRTLRFLFFNGEEQGLLASAAYARELAAAQAAVVAYVGFDMVGINYPSTAGCLCIYSGEGFADVFVPIQEAVAFDLLGFPRGNDTVQVFPDHKTRNSDEASFQSAGLPTMRWAGLASARHYWAYHKLNDTVETMQRQAGGADALARGFETATASAYYTVLALDRHARGPWLS